VDCKGFSKFTADEAYEYAINVQLILILMINISSRLIVILNQIIFVLPDNDTSFSPVLLNDVVDCVVNDIKKRLKVFDLLLSSEYTMRERLFHL